MLNIVIFFLLVSVYLYVLLGGADFGAGIIELFTGKRNEERVKKLVNSSIAPIWEANHMWLIIAVVILFNAFPRVYTQVMTYLYIPMILMLVGIVLRGTAFTFRHYDAVVDGTQKTYTAVFSISSLLVSFFLGTIIGGITSETVTESGSFAEMFLYPWLNPYSIAVGVFVTAIFAFTASVYLIGDSTDQTTRRIFIRKSKIFTFVMVIAGGAVFASSYILKMPFAERFFAGTYSLVLLGLATLSLPLLWQSIDRGKIWRSRFLAGGQILFVLSAFYIVFFPSILLYKDGKELTLYNSAAPEVTLTYLGAALIFGSLLIFPSLFYLLHVFKLKKREEK